MRQPHCLSRLPSSVFLCMWLGEDSAGCVARLQHKLFFFPETLAVLCIVPFSFLHQPVSAKHENYRRLVRNLEQQLLLDNQLREQRWMGLVVWEPWCARCMQPFVKDIEIIVDG